MSEPYLRWASSAEAAIRTAQPNSLAALDAVLATWRASLEALEQQPATGGAGAGRQAEVAERAVASPRELEGEESEEPPRRTETTGRTARAGRAGHGHETRMYLVTQTNQPGALGLHQTSWVRMEERLALGRFGLAGSGSRAKRVYSRTQAEQLWEAAGLRGPMPVVDPAP